MFIPPFLTISNKQTGLKSEFEKKTFPYLDILYNFALRMTGNENEAGNLTVETFLRAFRFFNHLDEETDYKAWLFRVIKNAYEDIYGKPANNQRIENDRNLYEGIKDSGISNSHLEITSYGNITKNGISKAILSLPEDLKTVIVLSDIEGFTYEEIVSFTDCPLAIVKERHNRARKILLNRLSKNGKEEESLSDLEIQSFIKSLFSENLKIEPAPENIREKVIKKIK